MGFVCVCVCVGGGIFSCLLVFMHFVELRSGSKQKFSAAYIYYYFFNTKTLNSGIL